MPPFTVSANVVDNATRQIEALGQAFARLGEAMGQCIPALVPLGVVVGAAVDAVETENGFAVVCRCGRRGYGAGLCVSCHNTCCYDCAVERDGHWYHAACAPPFRRAIALGGL